MSTVITGWGVAAPIGIGRAAFAEGVHNHRSGIVDSSSVSWPEGRQPPQVRAGVVQGLDIAGILGTRKGTRVLDRTASLALASCTLALRESGLLGQPGAGVDVGVVFGTSNGSVKAASDFTGETIATDSPFLVSPEAFPNSVMNFAASQCSIWHKLQALNTTISGGRMACLLALRYSERMLRLGYAKAVVAGAAEELTEHLAWGAHYAARARGAEPPVPGEGSAMFVLEEPATAAARGAPDGLRLLACEVGTCTADLGERRRAFSACIGRALARAGVAPEEVWAVSLRESGIALLDDLERESLELALGPHSPGKRIALARQVGDAFSASGALQVAALLALFQTLGEGGRRIGLVTSLTHGGAHGCAVLASS